MGAVGRERVQVSPVLVLGSIAFVIGISTYFYKLGARADRGAVVIELVSANPASATPGSAGAQ